MLIDAIDFDQAKAGRLLYGDKCVDFTAHTLCVAVANPRSKRLYNFYWNPWGEPITDVTRLVIEP